MKERITRMLRTLGKLMALLVPVALFLYGFWTFPLAAFGPDRALLLGDLGESRSGNYILEHFHQFACGNVESYWDAPFMYPRKNMLASGENLIGTAPLYSLFRQLGFNRESGYQLWILALFSLNYLCCFIALFAWSRRSVLSACGAFVFAFGIHLLGQLDHAAAFPRFMVPLAFYWWWQWLEEGRPRHLFFTVLAVVFQFYCSVHLGFILFYALLFLAVGHVAVHLRELRRYRPTGSRPVLLGAGALVLAVLLLLPLVIHYSNATRLAEASEFGGLKNTLSQLRSFFVAHPAALSWRSLSEGDRGAASVDFVGIVPWLAIVLLPLALWKSYTGIASRRPLAAFSVALLFAVVFSMCIGDLTPHSTIGRLPGRGMLHAIDRSMPVLAMYLVLLLVAVFSAAWRADRPWLNVVLSVVLPFAVVVDNKLDVRELLRYDKHAAREMVERARLDIQVRADSTTRAVAYAPALGVLDSAAERVRSAQLQLTAMLAAQELGIPVVNAYAGTYPLDHPAFRNALDARGLDIWFASNGATADGIVVANNVHLPVLAVDTVVLRAANGKVLRVDTMGGNKGVADGDMAGLGETFVRLRLKDDRAAFVAHTDRFLSVELHHDSGLVAVSDRLGDMGIFRIEEQTGNTVALRADNDRYLALDTLSHRIFAVADSTDPLRLFTLRRVVRGSLAPVVR